MYEEIVAITLNKVAVVLRARKLISGPEQLALSRSSQNKRITGHAASICGAQLSPAQVEVLRSRTVLVATQMALSE